MATMMKILAKIKAELFSQFPNYDRRGLYFQAVVMVVCWAIWEMHIAVTGKPIFTGYAIAALAFVGAVIAVRADALTSIEKMVWILICGALLSGECFAIDQEHSAQEAEHFADMRQQQQSFDTTMDKVNKVLGKAEEASTAATQASQETARSLNTLSGGDSYCYLNHYWPKVRTGIPAFDNDPSSASGYLVKRGKYPLYGVHIYVTSFTPNSELYTSATLPDFGPGDTHYTGVLRKEIKTWANAPGPETNFNIPRGVELLSNRIDVAIDYSGRNGSWRQVFHGIVREEHSPNHGWFFDEETIVTRDGKVLYSHADPAFPKDDGYQWMAH